MMEEDAGTRREKRIMSITTAETLRSIFTTDTACAALVADRVYLSAVPEKAARPHLMVSLTAADSLHLGGLPTAWRPTAVEVAAVGDTYQQAVQLESAAMLALVNASDSAIAAVEFTGAYDAPNLDESQTLFARVQTFLVTFQ